MLGAFAWDASKPLSVLFSFKRGLNECSLGERAGSAGHPPRSASNSRETMRYVAGPSDHEV